MSRDVPRKRIAFVTASFPYPPGEQFIESEIAHWSNLGWANVYLCPTTMRDKQRLVPDDITVVDPPKRTRWLTFSSGARALFSGVFWKELGYLLEMGKLSASCILLALRSVAGTKRSEYILKYQLGRIGKPLDVAYCYWNDNSAYAACLLKRKGLIPQVLTRAHRFDLYEEQRPKHYMPLKRQFRNEFDKIFAISEQGKDYLISTFNFINDRISLSRLGVSLPEMTSLKKASSGFHIVSVSSCIPVKRVDKIIEAIAMLANGSFELDIEWTHIGEGELKSALITQAENKLSSLSNVNWHFVGAISNREVLAFYESCPVDVLVNTSESEGIPVSIMEAMARGVPCVAPNVGGISELVDDSCGWLLSAECSISEVAAALENVAKKNEYVGKSIGASKKIKEYYSAKSNYDQFVEDMRVIVDDAGITR